MKILIITSLSFIATVAATIIPRISFLLDSNNYNPDSNDSYDYR